VMVVSSPTWFDDRHLHAITELAGRRASRFPGNGELLDASINWLAGLDELVAPGPQVRDIPRIDAIAPGPLAALRWTVALAPPVLTLILAVVVHMRRR